MPGPGEVLVAVKAAGINPGEIAIREGRLHERWPATFPSGEGTDFAGIGEAVGDGVTGFCRRRRGLGWTEQRASHAELVVAPADQLTPSPPACHGRSPGRCSSSLRGQGVRGGGRARSPARPWS